MDITLPSNQELATLFPGLDASQSKDRKRALLMCYAMLGGLYRACAAAHVVPALHYIWQRNDPAYAEAYKEAQRMAADVLENAAFRRSVDGVDKPVFFQGDKVGDTTEYSDSLLKFMLKGNRPEKYMDRTDITSGGASLRIVIDGGDDASSDTDSPAQE